MRGLLGHVNERDYERGVGIPMKPPGKNVLHITVLPSFQSSVFSRFNMIGHSSNTCQDFPDLSQTPEMFH